MKPHETQSTDTRASCAQSLGARTDARAGPRRCPRSSAQEAPTPAARPRRTPRLLPLTAGAAGPGPTEPGREAPGQGGRRPARPGSARLRVRPGRPAHVLRRPRGQPAPRRRPARLGPQPPPPAVLSARTCAGPPAPCLPRGRPRAGGRGRGRGRGRALPAARPPPRRRPPARRRLRCGAAREGAGPAAAARPRLPPPSRPRAEPPPRRTYLLAPRGAARRRPGARERRDGEGAGAGDRGARRIGSACGREGARRVSVGRGREAGYRRGEGRGDVAPTFSPFPWGSFAGWGNPSAERERPGAGAGRAGLRRETPPPRSRLRAGSPTAPRWDAASPRPSPLLPGAQRPR